MAASPHFSLSSRGRLTDRDLGHFRARLFHRVARTVCHAGAFRVRSCSKRGRWPRRVRRLFRAAASSIWRAGHGLLAQILLLLDDSSPCALAVDKTVPASRAKLHEALVLQWPRIAGRVTFAAGPLEDVVILPDDIVVSCHACGSLTDLVLERGAHARARVAVLPAYDPPPATLVIWPAGLTARSPSISAKPCV
jgi:hypothetical protein